jgi:hypothetical protein
MNPWAHEPMSPWTPEPLNPWAHEPLNQLSGAKRRQIPTSNFQLLINDCNLLP